MEGAQFTAPRAVNLELLLTSLPGCFGDLPGGDQDAHVVAQVVGRQVQRQQQQRQQLQLQLFSRAFSHQPRLEA